jgi:hypothetical protein
MSWSISFIGNSNNVIKALEDHSNKLNGQSKSEYDEALPSLLKLVQLNHNEQQAVIIKITASGHASSSYSNCSVTLEQPYVTVV